MSDDRQFVKLTMRSSEIATWIEADEICWVEQMDGWTRVRTKHGDTAYVIERAETVLALIGAVVVEAVAEVKTSLTF